MQCRKDKNLLSDWDKIGCHMVAVPTALVPAAIQQYVKTSFGGTSVTKIDKERYGYDVELSNGMELKFNHQGVCIGYDD
ncbi:MAG: PepSY-like domain-containing protein [Prevotella sp.]|nr:PepSY-like domain-containing protein [Prevotella sp.]